MSRITLTFLKPGLNTLILDSGRNGYQHFGVPLGGPLDRASARWANRLVSNPTGYPVLEITLLGPQIQVSGSGLLALTGADLSPKINNKIISMCKAFEAKEGDTLSFGKPQRGCRAYLGVAGDWLLQPWLGSVSTATHHPEIFTPDSLITKGSVVTIDTSKATKRGAIYSEPLPLAGDSQIRVMPGPEFNRFDKLTIGSFFSQAYTIGTDSNRMGYRLSPKLPGFIVKEELISSGIIPGTIQVTNDGQPIVLLADAQTTGGYHRIAVIIDEDLDLMGQLKPGDTFRFKLVTGSEYL